MNRAGTSELVQPGLASPSRRRDRFLEASERPVEPDEVGARAVLDEIAASARRSSRVQACSSANASSILPCCAKASPTRPWAIARSRCQSTLWGSVLAKRSRMASVCPGSRLQRLRRVALGERRLPVSMSETDTSCSQQDCSGRLWPGAPRSPGSPRRSASASAGLTLRVFSVAQRLRRWRDRAASRHCLEWSLSGAWRWQGLPYKR